MNSPAPKVSRLDSDTDFRYLLRLVLTSALLAASAALLAVFLLGQHHTDLFADAQYTVNVIPVYSPFTTHIGDVLATLLVAFFLVFVTGSAVLGAFLFSILYLVNLLKIYVLRVHLVHHDIFLLGDLYKGVDWLPRITLIGLIIIIVLAVYYGFSRRKLSLRISVALGFIIVSSLCLYNADPVMNALLTSKLAHERERDPYGSVLYNGPIMAVVVYELNYQHMMNLMTGAHFRPSIHPEFDFRAVPVGMIKTRPNIYILMLESYLDPYHFSALHFNVPPISGLFADYVGKTNSSAFYNIRSTAAAEFEVLCGLPNQPAYAGRIFDYMLDQSSELNCLPHYLKTLGYNTIASHPNVAIMYNRVNAYPIVGFQRIHFSPDLDMSDRDSIWLNDASFLNQNLEMVKNQLKTHRPFLNYVMTVGGHYPYTLNEKRPPMLKVPQELMHLADRSLQLTYYTGKAVDDYLKAIRRLDPNALIIIMGDHFPYVINDNDPFIQWAQTHTVADAHSYAPVHHLYDLQHQTFGMMIYRSKRLPLRYFEQFDVANIAVNILTDNRWCSEHTCLQQRPYMLVGDSILDRDTPAENYCRIRDATGEHTVHEGPKVQQCSQATQLRQTYLSLYQKMLYPFFY